MQSLIVTFVPSLFHVFFGIPLLNRFNYYVILQTNIFSNCLFENTELKHAIVDRCVCFLSISFCFSDILFLNR